MEIGRFFDGDGRHAPGRVTPAGSGQLTVELQGRTTPPFQRWA